jgi:phosphate transport system substrate-binding protein
MFSQPYFNAGQAIAVRQGSDITSPADLAERNVGVQEGTTGEIWAQQNTSAIVTPYADVEQIFTALAQGEIDAVIYDQLIAIEFINKNPDMQLTLLDELVTTELYGIAVRRDRADLLEMINAGLSQKMNDGSYQQICENWFGTAEACLSSPMPVVSSSTSDPTPETSNTDTSSETVPVPEFTESPVDPNLPLLNCNPEAVASNQTGSAYRIQAGDWLSAIAEREYGNPLDYRAIVTSNHRQSQADNTYTCIDDPNLISVDWMIYLPTSDEVAAYWNEQLVSLPPIDWNVAGEINVTGSSTVYPLTRQLAHCFQAGGFADPINIESTGTLAGFEKFCAGEVDIANASHPMSEADRALCQSNGLTPLEFQVGTDALAIVVSNKNNFANNVTPEELQQILGTADLWSKVRPEWPAEPIKRYYPTEKSGTFASLVDVLFAGDTSALLNAPNIVLQSELDKELVAGIQNDPWAVGFFGYAYYQQNKELLHTLPVQGIKPLPETVDQKTYPLVRPLFIYTAAEAMSEKPQVAAFINFYLSNVKEYVINVGYFLPTQEALEKAIQTYNEAGP